MKLEIKKEEFLPNLPRQSFLLLLFNITITKESP
jgi:hypothetical protein